MLELTEKNIAPTIKWEALNNVYGNPKQNMCILCLIDKLWTINFLHDNNYVNKKMPRDEFDSSSTLYECTELSKFNLVKYLSFLVISELACSACHELHESYS